MRQCGIFCFLTFAAAMCGCGGHAGPVISAGPRTPAERNFDAVWRASLDVLGEYNFEIDRRNKRAGVITTLPMTGRHWFEFWRKDAAAGNNLAEGTVQTVYRAATVSIRPSSNRQDSFSDHRLAHQVWNGLDLLP